MACTLVLVGDPAHHTLSPPLAQSVAAALDADAVTWLSPERACEIAVDAHDAAAALATARGVLAGARVDAAALPPGDRKKRLLVADMDSTIVTDETLDMMAEMAGLADRILPITARAMNGEIDFAEALRQRVALMAGRSADIIDRALAAVRLTPGAAALVATMRRAGARTVLISGGFTPFVERVAAQLGFDEARGNHLEVADGRLTGRVVGEIVVRETKLATLRQHSRDLGLSPAETLAVGDGANDVPMLQAAGLGVAFRAKPSVRQAIDTVIDHGDLTALLYLQGYSDAQIAWAGDDRR